VPKIETSSDAISYLEMAVKVEGWTNPKDSASWQIMQVLKTQKYIIDRMSSRYFLCGRLTREITDHAWKSRAEWERDQSAIVEWISVICAVHGDSEFHKFTSLLAENWLIDTSKAPLPAEYAYKRSKGERV
jgi:hypothetical protein